MTVLAEQYADGKLGLTKSDAEAAAWHRKAADRGSARAVYDLALMYQEGRGLAKDETEAKRLFQQGDNLNSPSAMVHVGLTYDIGQRVAKDQAESLRWYRKAADLGDANGMWFVGMAYRFGNGVAKDQTEAASWYRKAAERGNTTAMAGLAEMYKAGEGVSKDEGEAERWRLAANGGSAPADTQSAAKAEEKVAAASPSEVSPSSSPSGEGPLRSFEPDEYDPVSIGFVPDGSRLLSLASGGYLRVLDPALGIEIEKFGEKSCLVLRSRPTASRLRRGVSMITPSSSGM
jgi:TPR repeat protein